MQKKSSASVRKSAKKPGNGIISELEILEPHLHLGGALKGEEYWHMGVERGIRGVKDYQNFIEALTLKPGKVRDLDNYLKPYEMVEQIQSGPRAMYKFLQRAASHAFLSAGDIGNFSEGARPIPYSFRLTGLELRYNPLKRTGAVEQRGQVAGLYDVDQIIKATCSSLEAFEIASGNSIRTGLIHCFGREMSEEANEILAHKTAKWARMSSKIVGIDLAGPESLNSLSDKKKLQHIKKCFEIATKEKRKGKRLGKTVHCGETPHVSLATFISTMQALEPDRVAHPIIAFKEFIEKKNDRGLKVLSEMGIVCEFCGFSNLITRAVPDLTYFTQIFKAADKFNIPFMLGTDASGLHKTTLGEEFLMYYKQNILTAPQLKRAIKVAQKYSFLPVRR